MPTLTRAGADIYYETHGEGDALLLSHSFSANTTMWEAQIARFAPAYRVIVWDMRGHGQTKTGDDAGAYSHPHIIADMAALLDACDAPRAILGGLSLGGYASLGFALAHAARVRALMLFDTGPGFKNPKAREGWNRYAFKQADRLDAKGLRALDATHGGFKHGSAHELAHAARGMLAQQESTVIASLDQITAPTLVLVGEKDAPFIGASDYMARKIPNAEKHVIPGAGHLANLDAPEAFNERMAAFLATLPAS